MNSKNTALRDTLRMIAGQALCTLAMVGIFALLGRFDLSVLWGGLAGAGVASANFFFMSYFANLAADKAEAQDIAGGQKLMQLSYMGRMAGLFVILALCAKSGQFHVLALVLPLAFTRPILTFTELFHKKGEKTA